MGGVAPVALVGGLAYQVWFLSPSLPVTAFLKSAAAAVLKDTPVITFIACRNMWLSAQEKMKVMLRDAGAEIREVLAVLAYGLFTMAALHALLMTVLERRLHGHAGAGSLAGPFSALPPLLSMEVLLFRLIAVGFILLTLTLLTGIVYSETIFGKAAKFDHKTVFAVASWLIFAALLAGRYLYGWRGRVALRWTLAGFLTLLLAYVGSRFVLEVILQRPTA